MMQNIRLEQGGFVKVSSRTLRPASFIKLQPQSVEFLDITNPRAVLEQKLRQYSALTKGDIILFRYNKKDFYLEVRPSLSTMQPPPTLPHHPLPPLLLIIMIINLVLLLVHLSMTAPLSHSLSFPLPRLFSHSLLLPGPRDST